MTKQEKVLTGIVAACALGSVGLLGYMFAMLYNLITALIMIAIAVGGATAITYGPFQVRKAIRRHRAKHQYKRDMEYTRFVALTWLTPADEEWLALRHGWTMPPEVARIRAGQPWNQVWYYDGKTPIEVKRMREIESMADKSKAELQGENRTTEVNSTKPVEGDIVDIRRNDGGVRRAKPWDDALEYGDYQ